jgi:hypothetical protein
MPLRVKANWTRELTKPITLIDGTELITLGDASKFVLERLSGLSGLRSQSLTHVVELLVIAAQSGTLADRKVATDQVCIVLSSKALIREAGASLRPA